MSKYFLYVGFLSHLNQFFFVWIVFVSIPSFFLFWCHSISSLSFVIPLSGNVSKLSNMNCKGLEMRCTQFQLKIWHVLKFKKFAFHYIPHDQTISLPCILKSWTPNIRISLKQKRCFQCCNKTCNAKLLKKYTKTSNLLLTHSRG